VALEEQWQRAAMAGEEQRRERSRSTRAAMTREQSGSSEVLLLGTLGDFSCARRTQS
jgi:hypothetical protein